MDTMRLVDPELRETLASFPKLELTAAALPAMRAVIAEQFAKLPIPDAPVTVTTMHAPGPQGAPQVRVLVYRPSAAKGMLPGIFHIHGGGYVIGAPDMADAPNRALAAALGCVIVSVDYRLAPETPHPGPVEDCYAALKWMYANAAELGVDPARIGVKGESAGGGLAAALALLARDRGEVKLAFQHLIYPMLDDRTCVAEAPHPFAGEFCWTAEQNRFGWRALLGREPGGEGVFCYASAARAADLAGLPPAFISVGALDLLLEEDIEYARRLMRAGVAVTLHVYPGAYHGFTQAAKARTAIAAERDSSEALARALHG